MMYIYEADNLHTLSYSAQDIINYATSLRFLRTVNSSEKLLRVLNKYYTNLSKLTWKDGVLTLYPSYDGNGIVSSFMHTHAFIVCVNEEACERIERTVLKNILNVKKYNPNDNIIRHMWICNQNAFNAQRDKRRNVTKYFSK